MTDDDDAQFEQRLARRLRAGARVVLLRTPEETRALARLDEVADALSLELRTWSAASGVDGAGASPSGSVVWRGPAMTRDQRTPV